MWRSILLANMTQKENITTKLAVAGNIYNSVLGVTMMNLFRLLKGGRRYKRKLEKRFGQDISRKQLNFACDERLILLLKILAKELEVPIYTLAEHLLQLGGSEVAILMEDEELRNQLCHHLAKHHLSEPEVRLQSEPVSQRVIRLQNAMKFLDLVEQRARSPEVVREIIERLIFEYGFTRG